MFFLIDIYYLIVKIKNKPVSPIIYLTYLYTTYYLTFKYKFIKKQTNEVPYEYYKS